MSSKSIVERFYTNLVDLIGLLLDIIPKNYKGLNWELLFLGKKYVETWTYQDKIDTLEAFIKRSEKYWSEQIKTRKESFFLEHASEIFAQFNEKVNIDVFKTLFLDKKILTEDDKGVIWDYIDSFVKQSIGYIHEKRLPQKVLHENKYQQAYGKEFMKEIKLSKHAMMWEMELKWG